MPTKTEQELRDLYDKSRAVEKRYYKRRHWLRMQLRRLTKRIHRRRAITARRKRKWLASKDGPRERVVKWALDQVGVHETPGRPNEGPQIDGWNRAVGLAPGPYAYWCGSFCHAALKHGRLDFPDWIRYTPSIYTYASRKQFGLSLVPPSKAEPGDMVLFNFDGGVVDHVGIYIGDGKTVEGNTSSTSGGSQNNGGGVYLKAPRATVHYVHIDYKKAPHKRKGVEGH